MSLLSLSDCLLLFFSPVFFWFWPRPNARKGIRKEEISCFIVARSRSLGACDGGGHELNE